MKIQVKQFAKKKIEALVKKDMQEWPPGCAGWMYQPKRPYVPEKHLQEKPKISLILRWHGCFPVFTNKNALCHFCFVGDSDFVTNFLHLITEA